MSKAKRTSHTEQATEPQRRLIVGQINDCNFALRSHTKEGQPINWNGLLGQLRIEEAKGRDSRQF